MTTSALLAFKPSQRTRQFSITPQTSLRNPWSSRLWYQIHGNKSKRITLVSSKCSPRATSDVAKLLLPVGLSLKKATLVTLDLTNAALTGTLSTVSTYPRYVQCGASAMVMAFAIWGLLPLVHSVRRSVFQRREWEKSHTKRVITSYLRPLMLWTAVALLCRALDPVVLASETSQAIKERMVNFLRSLSTVLTFAFCTARLTQQIQKFMMERHTKEDARNLGIQFIGNAVSTSVWVAAVCLFMELLGFSTQKWLTAGGFGTVLLTLAGREIFTNFLSSVMIHATRPFVQNEWVQTKIDGQEVSGTVEHVGWWSPTIIRGEDREAVHIPNHKFTMSVVRNLTQKTHWRIKTHIGISHIDFSKINLIIADMRKILAKHPQVEHRKLHRRVFFDTIDPVNQSLMIIVSCFVKTCHYEEYLSVKETILFNLLKVISHHNAHLATPMRTIQRVYDDTETRPAPFRGSYGRPVLLVEATSVNGAVKTVDVEPVPAKSEHGIPSETGTTIAEAVENVEKPQVEFAETKKDEVQQRVTEAKPAPEKKVPADTSAKTDDKKQPEIEQLDPPKEASIKSSKGDDKKQPEEQLKEVIKDNDDPWKETASSVEPTKSGLSNPESFKENLVKGGGSLHNAPTVLDNLNPKPAVATTE